MIWRSEREKRLRLVRKGLLLPITAEECRVAESRIAKPEAQSPAQLLPTGPVYVAIAPSKPLPPRIRRSENLVNALRESYLNDARADRATAREWLNRATNAASGQNPDTKPSAPGTYSERNSTYGSGKR